MYGLIVSVAQTVLSDVCSLKNRLQPNCVWRSDRALLSEDAEKQLNQVRGMNKGN